ncbi:ATP-binding cassette domain-containing protein [Paeniglutamicibacter sp. NPDC091659]|uniref:ABC transporter ATP-binding protein n=1 Tax=Paeniglutamicibacter sp. NPDC091659 TaxID=3364389 RepID=UPI0038277176
MSSTSPAVEVVGLCKSFGPHIVLDGLDLRAETGQVAGFLGPNGSGRSTTFRILLGMLRAEATTMRVLGGDPWNDAVALHRRIAYVPGEVSLWPNLTGGQAIDIIGRLRGGVDKRRRDELLQLFDLDPTKKARAYSQGNRQKVALVSALASDAELLVLDEPTLGFDPLMEAAFRDCIREAKARGRTVLLSSNSFAEVEILCDTVTIIRRGRTVESGRLDGLPRLHHTAVSVILDDPTALASMPGVNDLVIDGQRATLTVADADMGAILAGLALLRPRGIVATRPTLEELFLRHYRTEPAADREVLP